MITDHKGKAYRNMIEMSRAWGLPYELVYQRHKIAKWPLYEALETPEEDGLFIIDENGEQYDTFAEMCSAHEISLSTYTGRRKRGWSRRDALVTKLVQPGRKTKDKEKIFSILDQLSGMTAEDLLNALDLYREIMDEERDVKAARFENRPRKKTGPAPKEYEDRYGNHFSCLREACEAYDQSYDLCKHRLFDNWPLQYALECPPGFNSFKDHIGNEFTTLASMCRYYEMDRAVFAKRYDAGWSLRDALMLPEGKVPKKMVGEEEESQ